MGLTYRRRRPETSHLYRAVAENLDLFYETYDQRFLEQHGPLSPTARRTLNAYIDCGFFHAGFGRAKCEECGRELLVPFSCQRRGGPCSSCQQKRAEILCRFVEEEVIEPVGHRQLVFVIPKMFRRHFHGDREMLTGLCRAAADATQQFYRTGLGRHDVSAGLVIVPQFFGDKVNPHVHLHGLVTDGTFDPDGNFYRLPFDIQDDIAVLQRLFEKRVLDLLVQHHRLGERLRDEILHDWQHTGFSVDGSVRVRKGDAAGLRRLVRYMARPPVSNERVTYDDKKGTVTVRSVRKLNGQRPVVARYDVLTFIALLALQVPPKGAHLVRYYGWYSARSRARRREQSTDVTDATKRTGARGAHGAHGVTELPPPHVRERRRRWAELLRLVLDVDPLECECGGRLRFISFVTRSQEDVLSRILDHIGEPSEPVARGPPKWYQLLLAAQHVEANAHVYGYHDGHGHGEHAEYDADAAWSSGEWNNA
jgi:hypothetical protein